MTAGLSIANLANKILDHLRGGTAWTQPAGLYCALHKGDPGSAGTSNASAVTTRVAVSFAAASNGAIGMTGTAPSWNMTTMETISHISIWTASSGGSFLFSIAFSSGKDVLPSDVLTLTSVGVALSPLAA